MAARPLAPFALAAVVALVACGSEDETSSSTDVSTTTATTTVAPAPSTSTTAPITTNPEATAPPTSPTTAPPNTVPAYDFSAVGPIVAGFVDERDLNGAGLVVVDREDGIVHQEFWGEFGPDRVTLVASSSKMVTAGVLLRLQDDGLLDIDAPISTYLDWGAGNPDVTVAQLLSNSSGLVGLLDDPGYAPYICQFLPGGSLQDCGEQIFTTTDDDDDVIAPDTRFRYGGAQWQVAGAVAEAVSGMPWAQLIDEIYVEPCGLDRLGYNNHFTQIGTQGFDYPDGFESDPGTLAATDNPNMEGGMYTDADDYAALLLMHLRGGECEGGRVLSQASLDAMHADRVGDVYGGEVLPGTGYGLGWWVDRATERISDPGAYGSVPWLDLDDGYGAFLVIEADTQTGSELAGRLYDVVDAAIVASRG